MAPQDIKLPQHGIVTAIGGENLGGSIEDALRNALLERPKNKRVKRALPDELLYNDKGLKLWTKILKSDENYQWDDEIALFNKHGAEIVQHFRKDAIMIDIGAGNLKKVRHLLNHLDEKAKQEKGPERCTYLALDISRASLEKGMEKLAGLKRVNFAGIWGHFGHGQDFVKKLNKQGRGNQLIFLSLGSVLFNDEENTAIERLEGWAKLMKPGDLILAGMDGHVITTEKEAKRAKETGQPNDNAKIQAAYNPMPHSKRIDSDIEDSDTDEPATGKLGAGKPVAGTSVVKDVNMEHILYKAFWENGFEHAKKTLGEEVLRWEDFEYKSNLDAGEQRHFFTFKAKKDIYFENKLVFTKGEVLEWFDAHKKDSTAVKSMCAAVGLAVIKSWQAPGSKMTQYLIKRVKF